MINIRKKFKLKKSAFTLVELIGIIIILGIIALISFPLIDGTIKKNKEEAYTQIITIIEDAAYRYSINHDIGHSDTKNKIDLYIFQEEGLLTDEIINPITKEELNGCVWYYWDQAYEQYTFEYDSMCNKYDTIPSINITYDNSLINEAGWAKENIAVNIFGVGNISYCIDNNECEPNEIIEIGNYTKFVTSEGQNYVCAIAKNSLGTTEKKCITIKLDKTLPVITGVADKTIYLKENINLTDNIYYNDSLSGIDGSLSIIPSTIDTSVKGNKQVIYEVKDKAGNIREIVRNIIVESGEPIVKYEVIGNNSINENGWAKNNFYVKATIIDRSGTGIKSAKSCVSNTSSDCTPTIDIEENEKTFYLNVEGSNRICIEAIDNEGNSSKMCSDTFNIDKTAPIVGNLILNGNKGFDDWYIGNVSIDKEDSTDALSGIDSDIISPNTYLNVDTKGTTYTLTATDLAGNTNSKNFIIKRDTVAPTTPTITGGSTTYKTSQTISLSKASTDETSGIKYYEYYISESNSTPSNNVNGTITYGDTTFTDAYDGEYIFYRAVDNAGNKSGWSNSQTLYVEKFEANFDLITNEYNYVEISNITSNTNDYVIKYSQGNQTKDYLISNGIDITESKKMSTSTNGFYTIGVFNSKLTDAIIKKVYIHNFNRSTSRSRSTTVTVNSGTSIIGTAFTNTGTASASLSGTTLTISASNGAYYDYSSGSTCSSFTCPNGGSLSGGICTGSSYFGGEGCNMYKCNYLGNWEYWTNTNEVSCPDGYTKSYSCAGAPTQSCENGEVHCSTCTARCNWNGNYVATCTSYSSYTDYYYRYTVGVILS